MNRRDYRDTIGAVGGRTRSPAAEHFSRHTARLERPGLRPQAPSETGPAIAKIAARRYAKAGIACRSG